ncbi:WD40 repeat domain-containing protein [Candidatus Dependentiae bacterium]|nr:WD40 repeat domain-containing protein [Candidatus Dependentiae bacterium]
MNTLKKIVLSIPFAFITSTLWCMNQPLKSREIDYLGETVPNKTIAIAYKGEDIIFYEKIVDECSTDFKTVEIGRISGPDYSLQNLLQFIRWGVDVPVDIKYYMADFLRKLIIKDNITFYLKPTMQFVGHSSPVTAVAFSPDNTTFLTGDSNGIICKQDILTGKELLRFNTENTRFIEFSSNGTAVLTQKERSTSANLWDISSQGKFSLSGLSKSSLACFNGRGDTVLARSKDNTLLIFDTKSGKQVGVLNQENIHLGVSSPDGKTIFTDSFDGTALLHKPSSTIELQSKPGYVKLVVFSPDSALLLTGTNPGQTGGTYEESIRLWDTNTGEELCKLPHTTLVYCAAFSCDGKKVVTASSDKIVRLWDTTSSKLLLELKGHSNYIFMVLFSRDGKKIFTAAWDKTVRLWDSITGEELVQLEHADSCESIAFNADNTCILTGSNIGITRFWDLIKCEDCTWIKEKSNHIQTWFLAKASQSKKINGCYIIEKNSLEHLIYLGLPDYVQDSLRSKYGLFILTNDCEINNRCTK